MSKVDLVRAWKDPVYRAGLSPELLAAIPAHPSGLVDLSDGELKKATGLNAVIGTTAPTCTMYTYAKHRCCPKG